MEAFRLIWADAGRSGRSRRTGCQPLVGEKSGDRGRDQLGAQASRGGGKLVQFRRKIVVKRHRGIRPHRSPALPGDGGHSVPSPPRILFTSVQDGPEQAGREASASSRPFVCCLGPSQRLLETARQAERSNKSEGCANARLRNATPRTRPPCPAASCSRRRLARACSIPRAIRPRSSASTRSRPRTWPWPGDGAARRTASASRSSWPTSVTPGVLSRLALPFHIPGERGPSRDQPT
jgi:hypothetical protein